MYCPRCGSNQSDESKFCKLCGANLFAVRQAVDSRETDPKFNWSNTWVAEMFLSHAENQKRKAEIERQRGITPEVKRFTEIKAGVITSCVGVGLTIFLNVLMQGIILNGHVSPGAAEVLSRIWVAGLLPICVGIALMINGLVVSKKLVQVARESRDMASNNLEAYPGSHLLQSPDTAEFIPPGFSVTESTTKHLTGSEQKQ